MKINELQARQSNVDVEGVIVDVSQPREFEKFGKKGKVANAQLQDETGKVKLSLWNEQIDQVSVGERVKISKGYVSEWQGELQLTTGKFGTLEIIGQSTEKKDKPVADDSEVTEDELEEATVMEEVKKAPPREESVTEDELEEAEAVEGHDDEDTGLDVEEEEVK